MKKLILLLAIVAISHRIIFSQGCLPEGITFTTQEQIDSFQINYPGCTEIEGDVNINGISVTNLIGLNLIELIDGSLNIEDNPNLINLIGLNSLINIGSSFNLQNNSSLINLEGINNLQSIGGLLSIFGNDNLNNLSGLDSLSYIGMLSVGGNINLVSLTGLENLVSIGSDFILGLSPALENVLGLESLQQIGGDLVFYTNYSLTTLEGLENLISVSSLLWIDNNYSLESLAGISNISTIGGDLYIGNNSSLTSLIGLGNITSNSIANLTIEDNPLLFDCDIQSICEYLLSPNGTVLIHGNLSGCNSPEEVQQHCLTSVNEISIQDEISLFPNPATTFITINVNGGQPIEEAIIYNHLGQKALVAVPVNNTVDVSTLTRGIYFIEVITSESRTGTKLVVE
jgi:hypothetical protein